MSRPEATLDIEIFRDYALFMFRRPDKSIVRYFEQYEGHPLDRAGVMACLKSLTIYTFNGRNYDIPITLFALKGADCQRLKDASDEIIQGGLRGWEFIDKYNLPNNPAWLDHVDLQEVMPGMVSLKIYGGRMHCRKMQDLPIEHDAEITPEQRPLLISYCGNDHEITWMARQKFAKELELRVKMSAEYGIDLRSKSDAQIAEAVMRTRINKLTNSRLQKPDIRPTTFHYQPPKFLKGCGDIMRPVVLDVLKAKFVVDRAGKVTMPPELHNRAVTIGQGVYRMGIGGLHSSEKSTTHLADDEWMLCDIDVASFYPSIIIKTRLFPKHVGEIFLQVYEGIFNERIAAKRAGSKTAANTLKIVLNGLFGKLGNVWSLFYSPDLMIQVTITGQLVLLMLIERIERAGGWNDGAMHVVSANTDGIVVKCRREHYDTLQKLVKQWEAETGFEMEETRYAWIAFRDVNSYQAAKLRYDSVRKEWTDEIESIKFKGAYAPPEPVASSWPSPHNQICVDAVADYLAWGFPIETTIRHCRDIRQFVEVRNVTGGATWRGQYLGKAVRWILSTDGDPIFYKKVNKAGNHNKVASTDGCRPMMELSEVFPADLNHDAYINEARGILKDLGVNPDVNSV